MPDKKKIGQKGQEQKSCVVLLFLLAFMLFFIFSYAAQIVEAANATIAYRSNTGNCGNGNGNNNLSCPKVREWNSTNSGSWGPELELLTAGSPVREAIIKYSPVSAKRILVTLSNDGSLDAYVCTSDCNDVNAWAVSNNIGSIWTTAPTVHQRGFDVDFETATGDAIVVYGVVNTNVTKDIAYKVLPAAKSVFNGIPEEYLNDSETANIQYTWIALDRKPTAGSVELIMVGFDDTSDDINGWVWNGTNFTSNVSVTNAATATGNFEALAVAYAADGTKGMVVGGDSTTGNVRGFYWNGGGTWTNTNPGDLAAGTADVQWLRLKADPATDDIMLVTLDTASDTGTSYWNGTAWNNTLAIDAAVDTASTRIVDFAWDPSGSKGILAWDTDGTGTTISQRRCSPQCTNTNVSTVSTYAGTGAWLALYSNPTDGDTINILGGRLNSNNDIGAFTHNGQNYTNYGDNDTTLNTNVTTFEGFSIDFQRSTNGVSCGEITGSMVLTGDVASNTTCFTLTTSHIVLDCAQFSVLYGLGRSGNGGNGIAAVNKTNETIKNCILRDINISGSFGIAINFSSVNLSTIANSTIDTNGTTDNYGIWLTNGSRGNTILNNTIRTNGTTNNMGIRFESFVQNNSIINNTIRTGANETNNYGVYFYYSSTGNNVSGNFILTNGSGTNYGVVLNSSGNGNGGANGVSNRFTFNNITTNGTNSYGTYITTSNRTSFNNTIFNAPVQWISTNGNTFNNFTNTTFSMGNGSIRFFDTFQLNNSQDLTWRKLNVTSNRTFMNSSNLTYLNVSAQITLNGITFTDPQPVVAFNDTNFEICNATICSEISISSNVFVFNVTRFTTYASNATAIASDTTAPKWTDPQRNQTTVYPNMFVEFNTSWTKDTGLSGYIFSTNQSGSFVNASFVTFTGTSNVSENTTRINASPDATVGWLFYANDTSDNFNQTDTQTFSVTALNLSAVNGSITGSTSINRTESTTFQGNCTCTPDTGGSCRTTVLTLQDNRTGSLSNSTTLGTAAIYVNTSSYALGTVAGTSSNVAFRIYANTPGTYQFRTQCNSPDALPGLANSTASTLTVSDGCGTTGATLTLGRNISASGSCMRLNASNITLDCAGYIIDYGATATGSGIIANGLTNVTVRNCIIRDANDTQAGSLGINFTSTNTSTIFNNTIRTNGSSASFGILLDNSRNNNFTGNNITTTGTDSYAINITNSTGSGSTNNTFTNTHLSYPVQWIAINAPVANNFTNTSFITLNGSIRWFDNISITGPQDISRARLNISTNNSFVNSTNLTFFNTSAQITLYGITVTDPEPLFALDNGDVPTFCPSPQCAEISYISNTFVFNVTQFTSHSSQESICDTLTSSRTLTQDVTSTGTCFIINTSNIYLNCNGFTVKYGTDVAGSGVEVINVTNVTIQDCFIRDNSSASGQSVGINISTSSTRITIVNNTIHTNGSNSSSVNYGIALTNGASNSTIRNNTLRTRGGGALTFSGNYGIYLPGGATNNTIANNTVRANGTATNYGIYLQDAIDNRLINNTVFTDGTGGSNYGIYLVFSGFDPSISALSGTNITRNTITTNGTTENSGIRLQGAAGNNTIVNNTIRTGGNESNNYGIHLSPSAANNNITWNKVNTNGSSDNHGIMLNSSANFNIFSYNNVSTVGDMSYGVYVLDANNTLFNNTILTAPVQWIRTGEDTFNNFTNTTFYNVDGSVRFFDTFQLNNTQNITIAKVNITLNRTFVNSTNLTYLNISAQITLNSITFLDPRPIVAFNNTNFEVCNATICSEISFSSNVFVFNVTQFTVYASNATPQTCGTITANTILGNDVSDGSTCFIINTSNIVLNCNGFTVTYGTSLAGTGIEVINVTNVTVQDCFIRDSNNGQQTSVGINMTITSTRITAVNNTIDTNGTSNNYGILLQSGVQNSTIRNNTIRTNGTQSGNYGIYLSSSSDSNNTIANNTIRTNGTANNYGINIISSINHVANNTIRTNGLLGSNVGIYVFEGGPGNNITRNTIRTNGTSANYGIIIDSPFLGMANNNTVFNNTIYTGGNESRNYGIFVTSAASDNNITRNTVLTNGSGSSHGIVVNSSATKNYLDYNNITTTGNLSYGIYISDANRTLFNNTLLTNPAQWIFTGENTFNNFTNTTFFNTDGSIMFFDNFQINNSHDITIARVNITFNRTLVNSTNLTFLNISAQITLTGITLADPGIFVDVEDDGTFVECSGDVCQGIAFGSNTVFNVTRFTTYRLEETQQVCGTISASTSLRNNATSNTTCFTISADNLFLNCTGYIVSYGGGGLAGTGIAADGRTNVTIKNCVVQDINASGEFGDAINFTSTNSSFAINNTIRTNGTNDNYGIYLSNAVDNILMNNSIRTRGNSSSNYGIYLNTLSSRNNITNNTILTNGTNSNYGIYLFSSSSRNNLSRNIINTNGTSTNYGIYLRLFSDTNSIKNSTIATWGSGGNNYGIFFNTTVFGNNITESTIITNGTILNHGVYVTNASNSTKIWNNTIIARGTGDDNYGIHLNLNTSGANVSRNAVFTNGSSFNFGMLVNRSADFNTITNNSIRAEGSSDFIYGIYISEGTEGNNITENSVTAYGRSNNIGINVDTANTTRVINNTVTGDGRGNSNAGIRLASVSASNITRNIVTANGTNNSRGIILFSAANNNTVDNNTIRTNSSGGGDNIGIFANGAASNNITRNAIHTDGGNGSTGITVSASFNNYFSYNNITTRFTDSYAISITSGNSSLFNNTIFTNPAQWISTSDDTFNNFTNTTFTNDFGSVRFIDTFQLNNSQNITLTKVNITQNRTFVNSTNFTYLNISAEITLTNITFNDPQPLIAFNNTNFEFCNATICTEISFTSNAFIFNTTRFTVYAANDSQPPTVGLNMTNFTISFGTGFYNASCTTGFALFAGDGTTPVCWLNSTGNPQPAVNNSHVIENTGNVVENISATLRNFANAEAFLCGTNNCPSTATARVQVRIENVEPSACLAGAQTSWATLANASGNFTVVLCSQLNSTDSNDAIRVYYNLTIPHDADQGTKAATITYEALQS